MFCIESDDYMSDDGVKLILKKWVAVPAKSKIVGIIGLDAFKYD